MSGTKTATNVQTDGYSDGKSTERNLPDSNSTTLALAHPTEAEKLTQFNYNGVSWKGPLTMETYIKREVHLASQGLTENNGLTYWVLTDTSVPEGSERLALCGCETIKKKALVAKNGMVRDVVCHGVASVFCPPGNRGRGYAQRMMKELGERLRTWLVEGPQRKDNEVLFSVLFSDIGKKFYAAQDWQPFPSSHVALSGRSVEGNADLVHLPQVKPLHEDDLASLCALDEHLIRESMRFSSRADYGNKTFVAVTPDIGTIRWHHARADFLSTEIFGKSLENRGAITTLPNSGTRVWCYWNHTWYSREPGEADKNTLHILRIVVEDRGIMDWEHGNPAGTKAYIPAIAALLNLAKEEAKNWNIGKVEIWNPTEPVIRAARLLEPGIEVIDRENDSIASLRWYGEVPEGGLDGDHVKWIGNEKYAWC